MKVFLTPTFKRAAKKFHRNEIKILEKAIVELRQDPNQGELKIGDLAGVRVYKFRMVNQLILSAYLYDEKIKELTLLSVAQHENFYTHLKKQLH